MRQVNKYATLVLALTLVACNSGKKEQQTDVLSVETETVGQTSQRLSKNYVGEVEAESSTPASFTGMGTLTQVMVEEGQSVTKGQTLALMDPTQNKNALQTAQAVLAQAQDAYERMKKLHDSKSLSDMDWVNVQSKLQQAQGTVDMARKALTDCTLKAPCSGVVGSGVMKSGETALPAQPVCNILYINKVKVNVSIPEQEIAKVTPQLTQGDGVSIKVAALGNAVFHSHSFTKGVQGDALTHTYTVNFELNNADHQLLPGMVAEVSLPALSGAEKDCTTLPIRCIQQSADGKEFVWVNKDGKAHRQDVTVGTTYGDRIEVTTGVSKGDKVIVAGYQKVSEGSLIK